MAQYASGSKSAPNSDSFWVHRLFNVYVRVFCAPNATILLILHTRQDQNDLQLKRWFFGNIDIYCNSIAGPLHSVIEAYTQPYSFHGRIKLIICQIRHELSVTIHEISISWKKKNVRWRTLYKLVILFHFFFFFCVMDTFKKICGFLVMFLCCCYYFYFIFCAVINVNYKKCQL